MRKILKTINTIDELDIELYERLEIGVEIQDFTEPNLSEREVKEIVNQYKILFANFKGIKSLHGPFLDLKPASPDLKIREVSYKRYLDTINIGTELGVDYIIFHSQINPYLNEPFLRDLNNKQNKEFWLKIIQETDYKGRILIENIFEEGPDLLKEYMDILEISNIGVNLDIGHARLGKVDLGEWIRSLKDHIEYIHVHSNNKKYDQHQAPEDDEIKELYRLLDENNINPAISLEYKVGNLSGEINRYL